MLEHYFYNLILNDHFYFDKLLFWMICLSAINFDLQSEKKRRKFIKIHLINSYKE